MNNEDIAIQLHESQKFTLDLIKQIGALEYRINVLENKGMTHPDRKELHKAWRESKDAEELHNGVETPKTSMEQCSDTVKVKHKHHVHGMTIDPSGKHQ